MLIYARMWNHKSHFYLEAITEIFTKKERFCFAFLDLEKAFDQVPRDVIYMVGFEETWCRRVVG